MKGILKETRRQGMILPCSCPFQFARLYGVRDMVSFIAVKVDDIAKVDEYHPEDSGDCQCSGGI